VTTVKYETPQLTALTPAINAIQDDVSKTPQGPFDGIEPEAVSAYEDWE